MKKENIKSKKEVKIKDKKSIIKKVVKKLVVKNVTKSISKKSVIKKVVDKNKKDINIKDKKNKKKEEDFVVNDSNLKNNIYYKDNNTCLYLDDCIKAMKRLPDNYVDLIFADPPYNLQLGEGDLFRPDRSKVDAVKDDWDKFDSFQDYDKFTIEWLKEARRILKKDGTIWVIGSYHNIFRVGFHLQNLDYWVLNDILWIKSNPMPNWKGTRFNNAHETMIWASKNQKSKYTFNYKSLKAGNDDKQMRSDWYIPICSGIERLKDNEGIKIHSTQKPQELLYRIILSTSNEGNIVLDPFNGSGTTGAVCKMLNRKYIGIDMSEKYLKASKERILKTKTFSNVSEGKVYEYGRPKVPIANLIESGMLKVGEYLYDKSKKIKAKLLANYTINYNGEIGSIHSISAKILNKESNNGWDFWFYENKGIIESIDNLRDKYLKLYGNKS